jgi:hypothetical protein
MAFLPVGIVLATIPIGIHLDRTRRERSNPEERRRTTQILLFKALLSISNQKDNIGV